MEEARYRHPKQIDAEERRERLIEEEILEDVTW